MSASKLRFLVLPLLAVGVLAFGQDRSDYLLERNVTASELTSIFLADGGCLVRARGVGPYDGGHRVEVTSDDYPVNDTRCSSMRTAALRAVKRELGVGNGAVP